MFARPTMGADSRGRRAAKIRCADQQHVLREQARQLDAMRQPEA
jgi:hypothetical protein